ncbi:helicase-related protein [Bifidobacterium castoris]|uniref:helicase-related protein n=1 Tax=Bifidobacterium castoris TaxID=2306972 RepID=UPI000F7EBF4C|nr:helicase-related protein [Bifidobacterium castoris]
MDSDTGEGESWEGDGYYAEVMGSGQSDEEEGCETQPEFVALTQNRNDDPLASATEQEIAELTDWATRYEGQPNARLNKLIEWLDSVCRPDGKRNWNNERVVIFTEYADTLEWIRGILESRGYTKERLATISGSTSAEERELIRTQFNKAPDEYPLRVLLATDAAGEGIDLQKYCHRLVNFDIPFNPSRLEQRVGRIDRYGQQHAPEIFYFKSDSKSGLGDDSDFLERLANKISIEQQDLKTVNPLIDKQIYAHFCKRDAAAVTLPTETTEAAAEMNNVLARGKELNRSLTELERDYAASRTRMHLSESAERRVVDEALELTNQPPLIPTNHAGIYKLPSLNPGWQPIANALRSILDPEKIPLITFNEIIAKGKDDKNTGATDSSVEDEVKSDDIAYMHLGSTLLDKAARTLRSNLYGQESKLHRVTAVVVPGLEYTCAAAVARLVLVGRSGLRVHEEIFVTGIRFGAQNMAEEKVLELLDDTLDAERPLQLADEAILKHLEAAWDEHQGRMKQRLEDAVMRRAEIRQQAVETSLHKREEDDKQRVHGIFSQFRANLQASLQRLKEEEDQEQMTLWLDEEQRQRARDIANMTERLGALDDEERKEIELVDLRYRNIRPYVSIAALVFAVNERDAQQWRQQ